MLDWPDCRNVRDLGGVPTGDGGRIRSGVLIRADDLANLTDEGVDAVRAAGVRRIIDLRGSVVVHCAAGKDRTGVLVALALSVAGVEPDEIAADYARTAECRPETILGTLEHIVERYGDVPEYLLRHGMAWDELDALRARLREG